MFTLQNSLTGTICICLCVARPRLLTSLFRFTFLELMHYVTMYINTYEKLYIICINNMLHHHYLSECVSAFFKLVFYRQASSGKTITLFTSSTLTYICRSFFNLRLKNLLSYRVGI